uniref:Uncharacterized protein n=1 Tax=Meloidogyne enterolobii TaxID=390850 RepID=A0A6V7VMF4_MELEN|nr:unnamed protein product [Meloidogyne enterolobii]
MNIYFLILILTQFYLTNEMENPASKRQKLEGESSSSKNTDKLEYVQQNIPTSPIPKMKFSLVEISFLINLLNKIGVEKIIDKSTKNIISIIQDEINFLPKLSQTEENYLFHFNGTFDKIYEVIVYHKNMLNALPKEVYNKETHKSEERFKKVIIEKRLRDLSLTMNVEDYNGFLKKCEICVENKDFNTNKEMYEEAMKILNKIIKSEEDCWSKRASFLMYKKCKGITNVEKNIFIFWHLIVFIQMLVKSFVEFYRKNNNYYKNELLSYYIAGLTDNREEISIKKYEKAVDELKEIADNFMSVIEKLNILQSKNIIFEFNEKKFERKNLIISLEEAEEEQSHVFNAKFSENYFTGEHKEMFIFLPLIYLDKV